MNQRSAAALVFKLRRDVTNPVEPGISKAFLLSIFGALVT